MSNITHAQPDEESEVSSNEGAAEGSEEMGGGENVTHPGHVGPAGGRSDTDPTIKNH